MASSRDDRRDLLVNTFAWASNVTSSVLIIFVIKALMSVYRFKFATTISGVHFIFCAWMVWGLEKAGGAKAADMPLRATLIFSAVGALSIGCANLSLLLNSVGFYQIAKLLMSPFVAAVEMLWLGKRFPAPVLVCMVVVLMGVGIVTVSDVTVHPPGVAMAGLFIVTGGIQQVLCGHMQTTLGLQGHQLMSNTSFLQGMILMIVGPFVDKLASSKWLMEWEASVPGLELLGLSCLLALGVNASQYLVLGRFSATSFQVLGHAKTLLVLIGGWLFFEETMNPRKLAGMTLAFLGMVGYGYFASRPVPADKAAAAAVALAKSGLTATHGAATSGAVGRETAAALGMARSTGAVDTDAQQPLLAGQGESGTGGLGKGSGGDAAEVLKRVGDPDVELGAVHRHKHAQ